ncbi:MAG: MATE family efflux transporter [Corallococcus sp.]|nr:MATE family efflux transporter [Corallococcus sp.]MCM1359358.1 MATE family efflux transporter [Corallococcus sp.]MCM1394801.1 MATE family efflux transporter [Corallococcus sp.]
MIQLSDHFTYKRLLRFVASPILMMVVCSVYSVVDGLFVSNFVGEDAFAALNLVFPYIMVLAAFGFMFGAGGTAIVSKTMGEGNEDKAKKYFTLIVIVAGCAGVVLAGVGIATLKPVSVWLGANGKDADLLPLCIRYGTIILSVLPFFMLQNMFQSFFTTAEKPKLGFVFTLVSGCTNIVLDALFVAAFKWGLTGAAVATAISQTVGGLAPIIYFSCKNGSKLRFQKPCFNGRVILKACTNGSSELVGNIAMSLVSVLYNKQLMDLVGKDGVNAYGVMMYLQFIFVAIFIGYCIGVTPIIGYNYGAQNKKELQNVFKKSMVIISVVALSMLALGEGLAVPIAKIFVGYKQSLFDMTVKGTLIYSVCYLFVGFNMFGSCLFTALNNGLISAILSISRTLVFQIVCIYVLPIWLGLNGVWLSTVVAEALALTVSVIMIVVFNRRYGYVRRKTDVVADESTEKTQADAKLRDAQPTDTER